MDSLSVRKATCLRWWFSCVFAALVLAGCGGGGGDGGTNSGDAVPLEVVNVRVGSTGFDTLEADNSFGSLQVTADVTGTLSALSGQTVYVIVEDPDQLFGQNAPSVTVNPDGLNNTIVLTGNNTLGRAGTYRGPLKVHVCLDATCQREFAGSPVVVPYLITVQPGLRVAATLPVEIATDFGAVPPPIDVPLTLPGGTQSVSAGVVIPSGQNLPPPVQARAGSVADSNVRLTPELALPGVYDVSVILSGTASLGSNLLSLRTSMPVRYTVRAVPGKLAAMLPAQADLVSLGGIGSTGAGVDQLVLAADGVLYTQVSRIVYLPPGPGGNLDAGGREWLLEVRPEPSTTRGATAFHLAGNSCFIVPPTLTTQCLASGRYEASVFFKSDAGAELAAPLRVTMTVN